MTGFSHNPLQTAIYQLLSADSALMAMVSGVYDRPPQGSDYPFVTLGESSIQDLSNIAATASGQVAHLHVWSREGGRKQAALIMERIYTLLNRAALSVTGQTLVEISFATSTILLEDDGWTYHGTMHFNVLLQAGA